jgi:diguanylate cyclase (GGDEF)-like protein/PAS domain S-box-containing protein
MHKYNYAQYHDKPVSQWHSEKTSKYDKNSTLEHIQYAAIIESSDDAIISKNLDGIITSWNKGAENIFGYSSSEAIGKSILLLVPEGLEAEENALFNQVRNGITVTHYETVRKSKNGMLIDISVSLSPMLNANGVVIGVSKIARDISDRKKREKYIHENESQFNFILENSPIAVRIVSKSTGQVIYANKNYCDLIECSVDQVKTINPMQYYSNPKDIEDIVEQLGEGNRVINKLVKLDIKLSIKWALVSFMEITFKHQLAILGWLYEVTDRIHIEEYKHQLAFSDALTQLPNRRMLMDSINQAVSANKRSGYYGALIFLDLNKFKALNDTHGHATGDLLLIEVGKRIKNCLRGMDIVARLGGDEFVALLNSVDIDENKSLEAAVIVAEKIRDCLEETYLLNTNLEGKSELTINYHCSASIGITVFNGQNVSPEEIIKQADMAMYHAKESSREMTRL